MICLKDQIRYENVISKRYEFHYEEFGTYMKQFLTDIKELKLYPNGKIFYCLNHVPIDKIMKVEFFIPIKGEPIELNEGMKYHSYFSVENMLSIRVLGDISSNTEAAYSAIFEFMKAGELEQVTPPFHVIDKVNDMGFITIKVGYMDKREYSNNKNL